MMYTELLIGNDSYKLRLTTKNSIALERALGYNPIEMFMKLDQNVMPKLDDVLTMVHAMLQPYHHGMNMDKVYDLYDAYCAEGKTMFDLIPVIAEVLKNSGYLPDEKKAKSEGNAEKN